MMKVAWKSGRVDGGSRYMNYAGTLALSFDASEHEEGEDARSTTDPIPCWPGIRTVDRRIVPQHGERHRKGTSLCVTAAGNVLGIEPLGSIGPICILCTVYAAQRH